MKKKQCIEFKGIKMKKLLLITIILNGIVFGQVSADLTIENQEVVGTDRWETHPPIQMPGTVIRWAM